LKFVVCLFFDAQSTVKAPLNPQWSRKNIMMMLFFVFKKIEERLKEGLTLHLFSFFAAFQNVQSVSRPVTNAMPPMHKHFTNHEP